MQYSIQNERLSITADTMGGELVSVQFNGVERLWQNDNGSWAGHAPLLFPCCGQFHVVVDGKEYEYRPHGFAKKSDFTLFEQGADYLTFALSSNEQTKAYYPFDFLFLVTYKLNGDTLEVYYDVKNTGDRTLYFACGAHDSFALKEKIGNYQIHFEQDETFNHYVHHKHNTLTGEIKVLGEGTTFDIPEDYLVNDSTVIFGKIRSRKVTLCHKDGTKVAEIAFPDFSNLLIWRSNEAQMVCVEPWTNLPDTEGVFDIELKDKYGVFEVAVGENKRITRSITYF